MIKFENTDIYGFESAVRGMRNSYNSWDKSDSWWDYGGFNIGEADLTLMRKLYKAGTSHRKWARFIHVSTDVTCPLYLWKEIDQYKIGTTTNSTSTMHKIDDHEFTTNDFSCEHLIDVDLEYNCSIYPCFADAYCGAFCPFDILNTVIESLNKCRESYIETKDKKYWWQMIQLLPSSYNQMRTYDLTYETLFNMYETRKGHRLDEWEDLRQWCLTLPYFERIVGE